MKRTAVAMMLLAGLGGCMSRSGSVPDMSQGARARMVPGLQGPWGQPVPMIGPYSSNAPSGAALAKQMMAQSVPLDMVHPHPVDSGVVQASGSLPAGSDSGLRPVNYVTPPGMSEPNLISPPGVPATPGAIQPGGMAGAIQPVGGMGPPGAVAALGIPPQAAQGGCRFPSQRTEVRFVGPAGMKVSWYGMRTDGLPGFGASTIEAPGRYNFSQGAIYRLKLSDIPNRAGVELYPTLEVVPANLRTASFIAHSSVPVFFSEDDFEQVANGNYVVKVIYLPYPQFADIAITGPDEVVSTRLEPGMDPVTEAMKRGSIMLIVRLGNIDLEAPNTPPMDAPNPYMNQPCGPRAGMMPPPGMMPAGNPLQQPATPAQPVTILPEAHQLLPTGLQK